jgi:hypothetical protein
MTAAWEVWFRLLLFFAYDLSSATKNLGRLQLQENNIDYVKIMLLYILVNDISQYPKRLQ